MYGARAHTSETNTCTINRLVWIKFFTIWCSVVQFLPILFRFGDDDAPLSKAQCRCGITAEWWLPREKKVHDRKSKDHKNDIHYLLVCFAHTHTDAVFFGCYCRLQHSISVECMRQCRRRLCAHKYTHAITMKKERRFFSPSFLVGKLYIYPGVGCTDIDVVCGSSKSF